MIYYGLHAVVTMGTGAHVEDQLTQLSRRPFCSVKLFMTYDGFAVDDSLVPAVCALVPRLHRHGACGKRCRDPPYERRLMELGRTDIRYHVVAHSETMEREAVAE